MRKIIICGDRNYTNRDKIYIAMIGFFCDEEFLLIEGGATGADSLAKDCAIQIGIPYKEFPADWNKYGKRAGPIRNKQMLDENPELVVGFHSDIKNSKGTKHMISIAEKKGIKTMVIP
jgi:hypothetical protein